MTDPLVSVIIPTYNRAHVICHAIDNVFEQTYKNVELIVIDDGSTDDTQVRLREYGSRIRLITQANKGSAAARNRGVEASRGEIIAFQDSDDLWTPTKLERQVSLLERVDKSVPCCLCNASFGAFNRKKQTSFNIACITFSHEEGLWLNVAEVLATRFVLFNQTAAIRRCAIEKVGGFDESLKYLEDYDLSLRLAVEGPWAFIREPLVIYCEGASNSLSQQAVRDPIVLKQREIAILERALTRVKNESDPTVHRRLESRLKVFRRLFLSAKLCQSESFIVRIAGKFISSFEHYCEAGFRRSPWYPRAVTIPMDGVKL